MRTMLSCEERERIKHKNKCRYIFSCKTATQEEVMSSPIVVFLFTFSRQWRIPVIAPPGTPASWCNQGVKITVCYLLYCISVSVCLPYLQACLQLFTLTIEHNRVLGATSLPIEVCYTYWNLQSAYTYLSLIPRSSNISLPGQVCKLPFNPKVGSTNQISQ